MKSPFVLVIFGATGDLAQNKLIPALLSLFKKGDLPSGFSIIGFARRPFSDKEFRDLLSAPINKQDVYESGDWDSFAKNIFYQQGEFSNEQAYIALMTRLKNLESQSGNGPQRLFYLATPPVNYEIILDMMAKADLSRSNGKDKVKVIIEKPFGKDLDTAQMLDRKLAEIFSEDQIFRVDHYLGKETVQNMLVFRFANSIFEPVWNKDYIDHVQITFAEKNGIEGRGKFFDGVGILRDVAQNHLLQLLTAVTMEQPRSFAKEAVRDERTKAIQAIQCIDPKDVTKFVVRGQYKGYSNEPDVSEASETETFVAMKLFVNSPRFSGVPFYLRAGKQMPENHVAISVVFKQTCHILFKEFGCPEEGNVLTIHIQPDEGISIRVIAKRPGSRRALSTVDLKFSYRDEFGGSGLSAYEKLLLDIFDGDQMQFNRSDELESSWEFITKILDGWTNDEKQIVQYQPGTWGPKEAQALIEKDHRKWL